MQSRKVSRRGILQSAAGAAGLAVGSRLLPGFLPKAHAQVAGEKAALVVLFLNGGYNAMFSNGGVFQGKYFGVSTSSVEQVGPGVLIDRSTFGTMPAFAKSHMANIGVRHGISDHDNARNADFHMGNRSAPLLLANALGGDASIKATVLGGQSLEGDHPAEGGITLQRTNDMRTTIDSLGGGTPNPKVPDRTIGARIMARANTMSNASIAANPKSLLSLASAYPASTATLQKAPQMLNFTDLSTAYRLNNSTRVNSINSKFAAAELMIAAGANFLAIVDDGWDSHGDSDGNGVRDQMKNEIMPALNTFLSRTVDPNGASADGRNVVLAIMGDFARSLPDSDHAPFLMTTVIGKYVKSGTNGQLSVDNRPRLSLATGTPSITEMWAYLAAVTKTPGSPFGANPHNLVL